MIDDLTLLLSLKTFNDTSSLDGNTLYGFWGLVCVFGGGEEEEGEEKEENEEGVAQGQLHEEGRQGRGWIWEASSLIHTKGQRRGERYILYGTA